MILDSLKALKQLLQELTPSHEIDLHACLTVQVENLHAVGHFKEQFSTLLQYARNLANIVYESTKRAVQWAAYYFTHQKSYYPIAPQAPPLNALPRISHLGPARKLNEREREIILDWAANNGKAVRQRTVHQKTTKFKAGTLPLNIYAASWKPTEKSRFGKKVLDCPASDTESPSETHSEKTRSN